MMEMACHMAKRCKEKLEERVVIPVECLDGANQRQDGRPFAILSIVLPGALRNLENHTDSSVLLRATARVVSYAFTPSIQADGLMPFAPDQWALTLGRSVHDC